MALKYPRGAEWRKWDLHLHTPASYDYDNKSVKNENIIDAMVTNGISVVAITDHHIIDDNVPRDWEAQFSQWASPRVGNS